MNGAVVSLNSRITGSFVYCTVRWTWIRYVACIIELVWRNSTLLGLEFNSLNVALRWTFARLF